VSHFPTEINKIDWLWWTLHTSQSASKLNLKILHFYGRLNLRRVYCWECHKLTFMYQWEVQWLMTKIDNLEATIAGLKSANEQLPRLLVRSTLVRFYEWLSECWNSWFQECTSHHRLLNSSCLLLIAHPNLPGMRKQTNTSDLEHLYHSVSERYRHSVQNLCKLSGAFEARVHVSYYFSATGCVVHHETLKDEW